MCIYLTALQVPSLSHRSKQKEQIGQVYFSRIGEVDLLLALVGSEKLSGGSVGRCFRVICGRNLRVRFSGRRPFSLTR